MIGVTSRNSQTPNTELLSREEEYTYIQQAKAGNERALKQLIDSNQGLIKKEARKHEHHVDLNVLMSAGAMGINKAVKKFDLSTGNKFSSYAVPTIYSEIRDCACRETGIGRITMENLCKMSRASVELNRELDREPTLEELAERCELSLQQVLNAWEKKNFSQPSSLNQQFGDGSLEWLDLHEDQTVDVWRSSENTETLDLIYQLESCGHLDNRQAKILIARYQGYPNTEIGKRFEVSRERIRQLVNSAKEKFTALIEGNLKLTPIKATKPVSAHRNIEPIGEGDQLLLELPVPKVARKPAMKRVDASRLGGRISGVIKKFFARTKEHFDVERSLFQSNQSIPKPTQPRKSGDHPYSTNEANDHSFLLIDLPRVGEARHPKSSGEYSSENLPKDCIRRVSQPGRNLDAQISEQNSQSSTDTSTGLANDWIVLVERERRRSTSTFPRSAHRRAIGGIADAAKRLLVLRRRGSHGIANRSWHQSASTDQRCGGLGRVRKTWRRCLEVSQVASAKAMQPFASAYQGIRGFESKFSQRRERTQFSLTNVFGTFGIGQREDRARPPTDYQDSFSTETNSFPIGGINMNLALKQATACVFGMWCSIVMLFWGFSADNWSRAPELLRSLSTQYSQEYQQFYLDEDINDLSVFVKDSGASTLEMEAVLEKNRRKEFLVEMMWFSRIVEIFFASTLGGFFSSFSTLWGLDLALPNEEPTT